MAFNIPANAVDSLLKILRKEMPNSELPKCSKTLLRTPPSKVRTIRLSNGGQYWHFGVQKILKSLDLVGILLPEIIKLNLNIDGIPIYSIKSQMWPILCTIEDLELKPMVIGIYYGTEKPGNVNDYSSTDEFLDQFTSEMVDLYENDHTSDGKRHKVIINSFVNDVPATALIKKTKGHTGHFSCTKCDAPGVSLPGCSTVCFPTYGAKRTDDTFRNLEQNEHHNGISLIASRLRHVNMVRDFPLDYMHLICIGLTRKCLTFWVVKPPDGKNKLRIEQINAINQEIQENLKNIPDDFNRKNFDIKQVKNWKATQYRTFLLYLGVVVLRDNIDQDVYEHFLLLHASTFICLSRQYFQYLDVADAMYHKFVEEFSRIYGQKYVSQNVHNVGHIVDDVKEFGTLDEFSAFKFENKLGMLKKLVKSGRLPLQQVAKRTYERFHYDVAKQLKKQKEQTSTLNAIYFEDFKIANLKEDDPNRWFFTKQQKHVSFDHLEERDGILFAVGNVLKNKQLLYQIPIYSRYGQFTFQF